MEPQSLLVSFERCRLNFRLLVSLNPYGWIPNAFLSLWFCEEAEILIAHAVVCECLDILVAAREVSIRISIICPVVGWRRRLEANTVIT